MFERMRTKKLLRKTIRQGNNKEIQNLFNDIVAVAQEEFSEDNDPTLAGFLVENLFKAFKSIYDNSEIVKQAMISELNDL